MDREQIVREVDRATQPPMTKADALEWLESLATEIECRIDALKEEMSDDD